jgi:hypothetical protein
VSLCYFVRRFVSPDEGDGFPGHFSFLPGLYDHYQHGLLETAVLSVSQLAAYNQFGKEELRTQSFKNYGSVIRSLQDIIQSGDQVIDDKVIATILLLCTYKVMMCIIRHLENDQADTTPGHQRRRVGRSK